MADSTEQSAAAQLLQQHLETASNAGSSHRVLVEEVEDEDLHKPVSSSETPAAPKPAPKPKTLDTQSRELFPELGGPKPKASVVAPIWGAKNNANGSTNGAAPANGTPQTSAPPSGVSTPIGSGRQGPGPHPLSIPGRNVETMLLDPPHILPRTQLKRPLPDILKDLNRKARANVTMHALGNGQLRFDAVGPQEHATQALKDLINQIGTKVGYARTLYGSNCWMIELTNFLLAKHHRWDPFVGEGAHYRQGRFYHQGYPGEDWSENPATKG